MTADPQIEGSRST